MKSNCSQEFPMLPDYGLYAADILGDGNCLFNSLSDQLYGTQSKHHEVRYRTIEYMREHKSFFSQFLDVLPGGATRRQPKRKNAGGFSTTLDAFSPTAEEVERAFENHLSRMTRGGTWGDNMELVAFTSAYDVNVMIWRREHRYQISASEPPNGKLTVHIAYHDWEHYSSIRNIDGPHHGQPQVKADATSSEMEASIQAPVAGASVLQPWQIENVISSCYFPVGREAAIRALEAQNGNLNNAVDQLMNDYEAGEAQFNSSTQSSSVERELDTEDHPRGGPQKKQDRRLSRNTKSALRRKNEDKEKKKEIGRRLCSQSDDSLEALINVHPPPHQTSRRRRGHERYVVHEGDSDDQSLRDDDFIPPLKDSDTSSNSEYSVPSQSQQPKLKIKLTSNAAKSKSTSPRPAPKNYSPPKRLLSARDKKTVKKHAQKLAAKERKQTSNKPAKMQSSSPSLGPTTDHSSQRSSSHPTMTTGLKILHI